MAEGEQSASDRPAPRVSPLRIVLIGLLVIMLIVLAIELRARRQSHQAFQELESMLDEEAGLEPAHVQEYLKRMPVDEYEAEGRRWIEVYRWDGALRSYSVYAIYRIGATKLLLAVNYNTPPPVGALPEQVSE